MVVTTSQCPCLNAYLYAFFKTYFFQFSEIHHVLIVFLLCFSATLVCRSGFRHVGQMWCIQEPSLSGVLCFPQGELCQRPEPFGTRPEQGHHYWQLAGILRLPSWKCSKSHLLCCIWHVRYYLWLYFIKGNTTIAMIISSLWVILQFRSSLFQSRRFL